MSHNEPVTVDPKELARAQDAWAHFTQLVKIGIVSCVGILVFLWFVFYYLA